MVGNPHRVLVHEDSTGHACHTIGCVSSWSGFCNGSNFLVQLLCGLPHLLLCTLLIVKSMSFYGICLVVVGVFCTVLAVWLFRPGTLGVGYRGTYSVFVCYLDIVWLWYFSLLVVICTVLVLFSCLVVLRVSCSYVCFCVTSVVCRYAIVDAVEVYRLHLVCRLLHLLCFFSLSWRLPVHSGLAAVSPSVVYAIVSWFQYT